MPKKSKHKILKSQKATKMLMIDPKIDESLSPRIKGMKTVYLGNLAQNYTLHVNGKDYPCNEAMMHAALPNIPLEEWEERFVRISILGGNTDLVTQLLQYFYMCEITVSMDTLRPILQASRILDLAHLQRACEFFLHGHLHPSNYFSWMNFSKEEDFEAIHKLCKDGIFKELDKIQQYQEFQRLSFVEIKELVEEHVKLGQNPDKLFCALLSWIQQNEGQNYEELFDLINLSKCSKQALSMATEEPYEKLLWSISFQNKLFRACLHAESTSNANVASASAGQQLSDDTDFHSKHCLNLTYPSVKKFALDMIRAFHAFQKDAKHVDITMKLSDMDVHAHQVVLAAGSPYFEAPVRSHVSQNENTRKLEADLTTMDPHVVPLIVGYMYSRSVQISNKVLLDHIYASDFLRMDGLLTKCKEYAEREVKMCTDNCIEWIIAHTTFGLPQAKTRAVSFISSDPKAVIHMDKFLQLEGTELLEILDFQPHYCWATNNPMSEKDLLEVLVKWINRDKESRKQHLPQLLISKVMQDCSVSWDLDIKHLLDSGSFGISERDQIWQIHCEKMTKVRLLLYYQSLHLKLDAQQSHPFPLQSAIFQSILYGLSLKLSCLYLEACLS